MKKHLMNAVLLSLCVVCSGGALIGCTPKTDVPVTNVKKSSDLKTKRTNLDRTQFEMSQDNWKPVQAAEQIPSPRNPFRGFSDAILAETLLRESINTEGSDLQLPEQLYGTRDYRVVGVITGTADPKVYIVDPAGNRFILRRGSLIGNNNGSISNIRRNGIEVYERIADKGQYIELPLYEEIEQNQKKIQLSLK
jgi:Tfp pilus assembly protein PilP